MPFYKRDLIKKDGEWKVKLDEIDKILLTKEDMNNKINLDKLNNTIEEKVEDYKDNLEDEFVKAYGSDTIKTLYNSTGKYNKLIRIYNNYDKCNEAMFLGLGCGFVGIFSLINSPLIGELKPTLMISSVTVFGVIFSIIGLRQKLIRNKIKKNFKELGIRI